MITEKLVKRFLHWVKEDAEGPTDHFSLIKHFSALTFFTFWSLGFVRSTQWPHLLVLWRHCSSNTETLATVVVSASPEQERTTTTALKQWALCCCTWPVLIHNRVTSYRVASCGVRSWRSHGRARRDRRADWQTKRAEGRRVSHLSSEVTWWFLVWGCKSSTRERTLPRLLTTTL